MKKYKCPCCGNLTLESEGNFDVCEICGWQDDNVQRAYPDFEGGANHLSLNQSRKALAEGEDLRELESQAAKRQWAREVEEARKAAEARGEEFSEEKYIRWLLDE